MNLLFDESHQFTRTMLMNNNRRVNLRIVLLLIFLASYSTLITAAEDKQYLAKTRLIFPLVGVSIITSGANTVDQNHHLSFDRAEKYALDISGVAADTKPLSKDKIASYKKSGLNIRHRGEPKRNESHYCFGRQVRSPANGVILSIKRNVADNTPEVLNNVTPLGNYMLIDHSNNEYSMLAHLRFNSIPIVYYAGMSVKQGEVIGQCGNSGRSRLPHLHYHLQNSNKPYQGKGLPVQFVEYIADDRYVASSQPVQGQIIKTE